jgi:dynein heavy chain
LLTKEFTVVKNIKRVRIEGKDYDYNPRDFRMYFTTKKANPHYLPEVFIRVSVINFTVTQLGLEEQLLAVVVLKEMPEIEQ